MNLFRVQRIAKIASCYYVSPGRNLTGFSIDKRLSWRYPLDCLLRWSRALEADSDGVGDNFSDGAQIAKSSYVCIQ